MQKINLATHEINCIFAHKLVGKTTIYHECQNQKSYFGNHAVSQAYCARCKAREPIMRNAEPVIERLPEARQMSIEEWIKEDRDEGV